MCVRAPGLEQVLPLLLSALDRGHTITPPYTPHTPLVHTRRSLTFHKSTTRTHNMCFQTFKIQHLASTDIVLNLRGSHLLGLLLRAQLLLLLRLCRTSCAEPLPLLSVRSFRTLFDDLSDCCFECTIYLYFSITPLLIVDYWISVPLN